MFQATTRLMLFVVGVFLAATVLVVGTIGPVIFSAARLTIILLLLWTVLIWFAEQRPFPRDPKTIWIVAFMAAFTLSFTMTLLSGAQPATLLLNAGQLVGGVFFALLLMYVVSTRRQLDALLTGYLASVLMTSISVFMAYGDEGRPGGLGGDPNHFAIQALMGIPIAILFFYTKPTYRLLWRIFTLTMSALALGAIVVSLSRTALVASVLMVGLWMFRFRRFDVLRYALPAAVVVAFAFVFVSERWTDRMGTMTSREGIESDDSAMSRVVVARYAFDAFTSNPILGTGYQSFGKWASKRVRYLRHADPLAGSGMRLYKNQVIHSSYLSTMAEMGLVGLIPYLAILILAWNQYTAAWRLARRARGDPELSMLGMYAVSLQLAYLSNLVAGFFMPSLPWKTVWFAIGLSGVVLKLTRQRVLEVEAGIAAEPQPTLEDADEFGFPQLTGQRPGDPWPEPR